MKRVAALLIAVAGLASCGFGTSTVHAAKCYTIKARYDTAMKYGNDLGAADQLLAAERENCGELGPRVTPGL